MTHEEKALEIIRLIFHGGLSRDKQEAVKQVAAIIQRGVEPEDNMEPYVAIYHWLHITTGKQGVSVFQGENEHQLLVFLNRCNSQNPGIWHYWY